MSVVNPSGWLKNAIKKGKVKDLHALTESICKTCDGVKDVLLFDGEWGEEVDFILERRDMYRQMFTLDGEVRSMSKCVTDFVHDPTVNKFCHGGKTFISDDGMIVPAVDGDVTRLSPGPARRVVEYSLIEQFAAMERERLVKHNLSPNQCVIAIGCLTDFWRMYFIPRDLVPYVCTTSMAIGGVDVELASAVPRGCSFIEMANTKFGGWTVVAGVNISTRCDLYVNRRTVKVLFEPIVDPFIDAEVRILHTVVNTARMVSEHALSRGKSQVTPYVLPNGLVTFTVEPVSSTLGGNDETTGNATNKGQKTKKHMKKRK